MSRVQPLLSLLAILWSLAAHGQGITLPEGKRVVLDNGTVLILSEKHDVPLIGVQAILAGGAVADPDGKHGLADLYAALIQKGAGERDAAGFAEAIDAVGGRLSATAGLEGITISGEFLARDADLMVELLADMLRRPALDSSEFEKLRERSINFILAAKDSDPGNLVPVYASAALFGQHPYGVPVSGSEASLAAITHRDVRRYFEDRVGGDRLIIAIAGDFDSNTMLESVSAAFADWRAASADAVEVAAAEPATERRVLIIDKPEATQTWFWIGNVGVARNFEQRADLDLANTLFGGRFTSILNTALRVESGLTYGARSVLVRPSQPGSVAISSFTATETTIEAIDMALELLGTWREVPPDPAMITSAQNYVLGQFPTRFETASQLAGLFALLEAYGLDAAYINDYGAAITAATAESLDAVIDRVYPSPDNVLLVLLGNAEAIRDAVTKYGPVTELAITEPRFHTE